MRQLVSESDHIAARQLEICVRWGECLLEAADFIRAAGGVEQWLGSHGIDIGIRGTSRTTAANLLTLARSGLETCQTAIEFAAEHPERLTTNRRHGPDFFVAALRAYSDRDMSLKPKPRREGKADREDTLRRRVEWLDNLLRRAVVELEQAVASGWRSKVLRAIKDEMTGAKMPGVASKPVPIAKRRAARAAHRTEPDMRLRKSGAGRSRDQARTLTKAAALAIEKPTAKASC